MLSTKISAIANAKELLKTQISIKNELNSLEVRDPSTKKAYPIRPFIQMCNFYIPTSVEMAGRGLNKRRWKINHFFGTAQYFIESAGFPEGKHPNHEEWCALRNDRFIVPVSVYGDIIRFDDPKVISWYDQIVAFPPKLYNALNSLVTAALQKHFAELPIIDEEEPFGALMIFQRHVVWKLVLQCIRAYPQISMALTSIEATPINNPADVNKLEADAHMLLTFKEFATCQSKFSHDSAFFGTVTAYLETQEFATPADRNRAADAVRKIQAQLESGNELSRPAFFDILLGIFRPNLGLTAVADVEAHLAVTAFHAEGKDYGNRGTSRKENANPQSAKRKSNMEVSSEKKYADLKSEFGQMRADISAIMVHLGMPDKKHRPHNDVNKQGKEQANLANPKKLKHMAKTSVAVSFPKRYVDEEDSAASDSDNHVQVEHAMFARVKPVPPPKLTVQSIFGQNSRTVSSRSMWDDDRIGSARPWPRSYEEGLTVAKALYDSPKYWEDDKASSTSSKTSLTTLTQHMEISEEQLHVKPLEPLKTCNSSPHTERLHADYRKYLAQDEDCYICEPHHLKKLRGHSEERDHQQDEEDDRVPQDEPDPMSNPGRFGPRHTRQTTRLASYNYPSPGFPDDSDGPGSMSDDMIDASQDDKNDIAGSSQDPVGTTSKPITRPESATPRPKIRRAPRSGTSAPTTAHQYGLRTLRPPTATEVLAAWPPLSAPGATNYDQHAATSTTAITSPRAAAFGDHPGDM